MPSILDIALDAVVGALHHQHASDGTVTLQRLPKWAMDQVADVRLAGAVSMPAGVRIELITDAPWIDVEVQLMHVDVDDSPPRPAVFDVVVDGGVVQCVETTSGTRVKVDRRSGRTEMLPGEPTTIHIAGIQGRRAGNVEIWLPHNAIVQLRDVRIPDACEASPAPQNRPVWVHHGSSISHCLEAVRPTETWPVWVARTADVSLLDLGFAGQCQLDQFVARAIRDSSCDAISLKVGVNVVEADSMRERVFVPALHGFLDTIRDGHPTTPLIVSTPIVCQPSTPAAGVSERSLTMDRVRTLITDVVTTRSAAGDNDLHLLDGMSLLGPDDAAHLIDGTHPDGAGYRLIAERFHRSSFGPAGPFAHLHSSDV